MKVIEKTKSLNKSLNKINVKYSKVFTSINVTYLF